MAQENSKLNNMLADLQNEKNAILPDDSKADTLLISSPKGDEIFYFGSTKNGLPDGFGIGFYKNKGYYIGNWSNNMRNGTGKHFYINGDKYEGGFLNDMRDGLGIYYYTTGDRYEVNWEKDLMHGEGLIISKDGKKKSGVWFEGKLLKSQ